MKPSVLPQNQSQRRVEQACWKSTSQLVQHLTASTYPHESLMYMRNLAVIAKMAAQQGTGCHDEITRSSDWFVCCLVQLKILIICILFVAANPDA